IEQRLSSTTPSGSRRCSCLLYPACAARRRAMFGDSCGVVSRALDARLEDAAASWLGRLPSLALRAGELPPLWPRADLAHRCSLLDRDGQAGEFFADRGLDVRQLVGQPLDVGAALLGGLRQL